MKPSLSGHVVKEYYSGNTHIMICDDYYRDKTKEEIDAIIARASETVLRAFRNQAEMEAMKQISEDKHDDDPE